MSPAFPGPGSRALPRALGYTLGMHRFAAIAALLVCGCSSTDRTATDASDEVGGGGSCTFSCLDASASDRPIAQQVRATLDTCAGADCHNIGVGGMLIAPGAEFDAMIGVRAFERPELFRVQPGDPVNSYVYIKLLCEGGVVGNCMPPGGATAGIMNAFRDWIEAGAPTM
jgi:hypothetical protein